ncbi:hypothetical protein ACSBR2_009318 [Camellia fascicularis]
MIVIMILTSTLVFAPDPSSLQDFCFAINNSSVFVNGKVCNEPKLANASDFLYSSLLTPQNISNLVGFIVTLVNVMQILGLNTLGISLARIDFVPYGLNPPYMHPCATEVIVVFEGTLYVSFVPCHPNNHLFTKPKPQCYVITIDNAMFGSNPMISDVVLAKAFQGDEKVVDYLQSQFWWAKN